MFFIRQLISPFIITSSQSKRLLMSPLAFSNAVASQPMVSLPSALFVSFHSLNISRIISNVLVLLFIRSRLIFSTEKPSSNPRWRYSWDTLSDTASSSSGNTLTFFMRVTGCNCSATLMNNAFGSFSFKAFWKYYILLVIRSVTNVLRA